MGKRAIAAVLLVQLALLGGCSVVEFEMRDGPKGGRARLAKADPGLDGCAQALGQSCVESRKVRSARHDSGPALSRPVEKAAQESSAEEPGPWIAGVLRSWVKTGMRLHPWAAADND